MVRRLCANTELNNQISAGAAVIPATGTATFSGFAAHSLRAGVDRVGGMGLQPAATRNAASIGFIVSFDSPDSLFTFGLTEGQADSADTQGNGRIGSDPRSTKGSPNRWMVEATPQNDAKYQQQNLNTRYPVPRFGRGRGRPARAQ